MRTDRDIIALDLESTGVNPTEAHIIQIAIQRLKINEAGRYESVGEWKTYVKPPISIPEEITTITGITDEMVQDAPVFADIAEKIVAKMRGCDLMTYNAMMLDLPLLSEECNRAGVDFLALHEFRLIDPFKVFSIEEPRTLTAALKFYCGREMENAHDAMADVSAMVAVFNAQLDRYDNIPTDPEEFVKYCNRGSEDVFADYARKLIWKGDKLYYTNWGKYKNQCVEEDPSYAYWIFNNNFPSDTKKVLEKYLDSVAAKEGNVF